MVKKEKLLMFLGLGALAYLILSKRGGPTTPGPIPLEELRSRAGQLGAMSRTMQSVAAATPRELEYILGTQPDIAQVLSARTPEGRLRTMWEIQSGRPMSETAGKVLTNELTRQHYATRWGQLSETIGRYDYYASVAQRYAASTAGSLTAGSFTEAIVKTDMPEEYRMLAPGPGRDPEALGIRDLRAQQSQIRRYFEEAGLGSPVNYLSAGQPGYQPWKSVHPSGAVVSSDIW